MSINNDNANSMSNNDNNNNTDGAEPKQSESSSEEIAVAFDPITLEPIPADKVFVLADIVSDNGKVHNTTFDISSLKTILYVARNEKPRPAIPRHPMTGKPFTEIQLRAIDDHQEPAVNAQFVQVHAEANAQRVREAQNEEKSEFLADLLMATTNDDDDDDAELREEPTDLIHEMSDEHSKCVETVLKYAHFPHSSHPDMQRCRELVEQPRLSIKDLGLTFFEVRLSCQSRADRRSGPCQYSIEDFVMTMLLLRGCTKRIVNVFGRLLNAPLFYAFREVFTCITQCHDVNTDRVETLLQTWVGYIRHVHAPTWIPKKLAVFLSILEESYCINKRTIPIMLTMSDWSLKTTKYLIWTTNLSVNSVRRIMRQYYVSDTHRQTLEQTMIHILGNYHACMKSDVGQLFSVRGSRVFNDVVKFKYYFACHTYNSSSSSSSSLPTSSTIYTRSESRQQLYTLVQNCFTYAEHELCKYIAERAMPHDKMAIFKFRECYMECLRAILDTREKEVVNAVSSTKQPVPSILSQKRTHRDIGAEEEDLTSSNLNPAASPTSKRQKPLPPSATSSSSS